MAGTNTTKSTSTSQEEIEKQHEKACHSIHLEKVSPMREHGEILLENKKLGGAGVSVSTRGRLNVTDLANLCLEGYNQFNTDKIYGSKNLWHSQHAARENVELTRPSHDRWGIQKVLFMFCDDFLQKVYVLPWWHSRGDIRKAIEPVLKLLEITPDQVVRCLLANLPPSTTIPVHCDSGSWVQRTHRVHVPILVEDPDLVYFACGETPQEMQRVSAVPGHVFEINNARYHTVSNCSTSHHRVHLILDYMEQSPPRFNLDKGEKISQTRRSMDRERDYNTRPTPSYLILGSQKAGTTSLYNYIIQHPLVVPAKRRETHLFDWRWQDTNTQKERTKFLNLYFHEEQLRHYPSCLTGDSTPSYLLDSRRVIPRLKALYPHCKYLKFLVLMRNPVERAQSHFAMVTSKDGTPAQLKTRGYEWRSKTFTQVMMEDLNKMRKVGLIPYWKIEDGTLCQSTFDKFIGSAEENAAWQRYMESIPLNTGSHSLVSRGLYALQLRPWLGEFDKKQFLPLTLESLSTLDETMTRVWKHLNLPEFEIENPEPSNTRCYEDQMDTSTRDYLARFYRPHNLYLSKMLGGDFGNGYDSVCEW